MSINLLNMTGDIQPCAECGNPVTWDEPAGDYRHVAVGQPACALALEGPSAPVDFIMGLPWTDSTTRADFKRGLGIIRAVAGGGFHPDDGVADLWVGDVLLFHPTEAKRLNGYLDLCCEAGHDPCELMLELDREAISAAPHDCMAHAEPFTYTGGSLNHGWRCSVCDALLQVG